LEVVSVGQTIHSPETTPNQFVNFWKRNIPSRRHQAKCARTDPDVEFTAAPINRPRIAVAPIASFGCRCVLVGDQHSGRIDEIIKDVSAFLISFRPCASLRHTRRTAQSRLRVDSRHPPSKQESPNEKYGVKKLEAAIP